MTWSLIERIASIILPVLGIVMLGYVYARKVQPDLRGLNRLTLEVLMPLLIMSSLASKSFDYSQQVPLLIGSAVVVLGSGLLGWVLANVMRAQKRVLIPPLMFNNCGNMGLPLSVYAFGADALPAAVALFAVSNTLHFTVGVWIVDHRANFRSLLTSNVMLGTWVGIALAYFKPDLPEGVLGTMKMVGDAGIPLMLISLGARFASLQADQFRAGVVGAIAAPVTGLMMALAVAPFLGLTDQQYGLLMLFAALPPAVLNFLIAEQFKAEPAKVAAIVLIGNLMSVIFVPIGLTLALLR